MPRVTNGPARLARRKRTLKRSKGYFGNSSRLYRYAKAALARAGQFAFRDRRRKKSDMRKLWIVRINAACREMGIQYSRFMGGLAKLNIGLDRKALSEMAIHDKPAFEELVKKSQAALKS